MSGDQSVYDAVGAPKAVRNLAERLLKVHQAPIRITRESSGYQIYLPCPDCIHTHGQRELDDPKYAINASKYLGLGAHQTDGPGDGMEFENANNRSGICMRTRDMPGDGRHVHSVTELLGMATVNDRHPDLKSIGKVSGQVLDERQSYWVPHPWGRGSPCPPGAGRMIPINLLAITDPDHPAVQYVRARRLDPELLWRQFRCGFCVAEYPVSRRLKIFYRRMPGGWCDTPQHRLIFHSMRGGEPRTWQGRYIERQSADGLQKQALHPYRTPLSWDTVATRTSVTGPWVPCRPFDATDARGNALWTPSKYRTAKHGDRQLMGWDAAIRDVPEPFAWCVLGEGPTDAARVGPGGMAIMGKSLPWGEVDRVARNFEVVFTAFDEDRSGRQATEKIQGQLLSAKRARTHTVVPLPIPAGMDPGDMEQERFDEVLQRALTKIARHGK